jgi:hypothetical protein
MLHAGPSSSSGSNNLPTAGTSSSTKDQDKKKVEHRGKVQEDKSKKNKKGNGLGICPPSCELQHILLFESTHCTACVF